MSEWTRKTIAECASDEPYSTQIGPFGKALTPEEYTETGVPLLRGVNVNHGRFYDDGFVFVSEETANRLSKFESYPGDVLLVHKGTLGQIGLMPTSRKYSRYLMGNSMLRVRCNLEKLIPEYLYYWLSSPEGQHYLFSRVSQVGVPQIQRPLTTLREASLPVPPLPEQKAIARILSSLDDKIELNRRMNETLEAMARAIFKDWFVDFGPTRAKQEGRAAYLPEHLWSLFPEAVDPETGLPQGWEVGNIGKCFKLIMGQSPPGDTYNDLGDGLPFFQGRTDFGFRFPENRKYCNSPTRIAEANDTLVSVRAPVGDINMAWEKCCIGRGIGSLRHKSGSKSFTYYSAWAIQKELFNYEHTGTVFGSITKIQFMNLSTIDPSQQFVLLFDEYISPVDDKIRSNVSESRTLADLRDRLLPKLMSGEIRVKEAEKIVEKSL